MGAPVGPAGCEGDGNLGPWSAGVNGGAFAARLRFDNNANYKLDQQVLGASVGYQATENLGLRVAVGAIASGSLRGQGREHDVEPGFVGSFALAKRWLGGKDELLWLTTTMAFGHARSHTRERGTSTRAESVSLSATDLRFGTLLGVTLWERLRPYVAGRIFFGPVFWELDGAALTGSDRDHYTVGGGAVLSLPAGINLQADGSFLGERSISGAASISF